MGDEDFVRLGRNNTGAPPPLLGKESAVAPGLVVFYIPRNSPNDRNNAREGGGGRRRGPGALRGAPGEAAAGGGGGRARCGAPGEGEGRSPGCAPPFFLLLLLPGGGGSVRGSPPPGLRVPARGRAKRGWGEEKCVGKLQLGGKRKKKKRQRVSEGARLGKCVPCFLLWQELVCNKSPEHFPCEREGT